MDNKDRITDEQLSKKACDAVDELGCIIKKTSRSMFDSLVIRTIETFSDSFDNLISKAKKKITKKGSVDVKDDNASK